MRPRRKLCVLPTPSVLCFFNTRSSWLPLAADVILPGQRTSLLPRTGAGPVISALGTAETNHRRSLARRTGSIRGVCTVWLLARLCSVLVLAGTTNMVRRVPSGMFSAGPRQCSCDAAWRYMCSPRWPSESRRHVGHCTMWKRRQRRVLAVHRSPRCGGAQFAFRASTMSILASAVNGTALHSRHPRPRPRS
jgi:hypothetical protein